MNRSLFQIAWKLILVSLLVGLALDFFDVSPVDLFHDIPQALGRIAAAAVRLAEWAGKYILLGAIIVVPLWLLLNLGSIKNKIRGRK